MTQDEKGSIQERLSRYTSTVITMTPVLERWSADCPFWTVDQEELLLAIPRSPTRGRIGAIVWALIGRNVTDDDLSITVMDAAEAIEAYLTSNDEPYAPGGLRVTADQITIDPGCCVGLDEWREWLNVPSGQMIYLGHSPDVLMEQRGPTLRLWQNKDQLLPGEPPGQSEQYIDIPGVALPDLLRGVHQDLVGFLVALRRWAKDIVPGMADRLVLAVDRHLQISAPLMPSRKDHAA